jgi:hypothetical protein
MTRRTKPFDALTKEGQHSRIKKVRQLMREIDVPLAALVPPTRVEPAAILSLGRSLRNKLHRVRGLNIPCERTLRNCRKELNVRAGTAVSTFILDDLHGAYVTDPCRLIRLLAHERHALTISGDKGADFTKLGVTYVDHKQKSHFQSLVVYQGDDNYRTLSNLQQHRLLMYVGDSAHFNNIFQYFQSLLDNGAFLNGDWPFIAALLALKGPSSTHPCFICTVDKRHFDTLGATRIGGETEGSIRQLPLLHCNALRIVPTPLHLFLGIGNRVISKMLLPLFGRDALSAAILAMKSKHTPGCGGLSDLFDLNGPELTRFIKRNIPASLIEANEHVEAADRDRVSMVMGWLTHLHHFLLLVCIWDEEQLKEFDSMVKEIIEQWHNVTQGHLFPKMHMLLHAVEFAKKHKFLGRVSESAIESSHAEFNELYNKHHLNQSTHPDVRMARSLSGHIDSNVARAPLGDITNTIARPARAFTR